MDKPGSSSTDSSLPDIKIGLKGSTREDIPYRNSSNDSDEDNEAQNRHSDESGVDYLKMAYSVMRQRSKDKDVRQAERVGRRSEASLQQRKALLEMRKRAEREAADARLQVEARSYFSFATTIKSGGRCSGFKLICCNGFSIFPFHL